VDSRTHRRWLDRMARELEELAEHLQCAYSTGEPDWEGTIDICIGGKNMSIQLWALAEAFLIRWTEWSLFHKRYLRLRSFEGEIDNAVKGWHSTNDTCRMIADRILPSRDFAGAFTYKGGGATCAERVFDHGFNDEPFDELMRFDDLLRVSHALRCSDEQWVSVRELVQKTFARLLGAVQRLPPAARTDLLHDLRVYAVSSLRLPGLFRSEPVGIELILVDKGSHNMEDRNQEQPHSEADKLVVEVIRPMLARLGELISDMGYDGLIDQVLEGGLLGGFTKGEICSQPLNLIPGSGEGACHQVLLALSRGIGKRSAVGWPKVLAGVRTHLTHCHPTTQAVLVVCDSWDASQFDREFYSDYVAWNDKGVRFVFAMASTVRGRTRLSELDVRFA